MKEYQTYIFDLDGTLLYSLEDLALSTNFALRQSGMPERTIDEVRRFVGNGVRKLMERAVPGGAANPLFDQTYATFRKHYLMHNLDHTRPYDGVEDMLHELTSRGKGLAIVSNKFDAATKELVAHFFADTVSVAIGEKENVRKKPAPDTVLEALHELRAEKDGAVYIGDSEVDIETARNSGLPCISVLWGFRDRDFLLAHGATQLVGKPEDIVDFERVQ